MSWDIYIPMLMAPDVKDAAIVGYVFNEESVWASVPGGELSKLTAEEIKALVNKERSILFSSGVSLAGTKCTVLRDQLGDDPWTLDLKTKTTEQQKDSFNITVAMSNKALVIVKGVKDVHGGKINKKAYEMAKHLRDHGS
ncbi:profilin-1 [Aplochiton taeniatus]